MNRWRRVQEVFDETVALDVEGRTRRLRALDDPELARRVESLLRADATPVDELDRGAGALAELLVDEPPADALLGTTFGPYRIDEHLGSGGMAHVYRATRAIAGTERRVALKVLRPSLDTDAFLERFRRERETLASLEHEHVVAFLDAGALPDGRPFLVMERVDGVELTRWGRGVALARRLRTFVRVLEAVQYAHRQLVVHRDLKPSNVLVTASGAPKLLDFGVAAIVGTDERDGRAPLTPLYASPEQRRGERVTAASDLYSLGVLLHELVTGEPPARGADDGPEIALRGDLGAIVRRALAHDPAHRYPSADRFADDLRRFLRHEPVSARPATWRYRTALFVRRQRGPIALAAALVAALALGWTGAVLDRRAAEREAGVGWGAHAQAKGVARVLEGWVTRAALRDPALADDAVAHLEAALGGRLAERPESETLVRLTLARLYLDRGDPDAALRHAERALELARTTRGVGTAERERAEALVGEARAARAATSARGR